jgi:hypothetical protein
VRRHVIALATAFGVLLTAGTGVAAASSPTQAVGQSAGTGQSASSTASSTQVAPSNSNISVRIGSPGNNGSVSQSNASTAASAALNAAATAQNATQSQGGGGGTQAVGQDAGTGQQATSSADSTQVKPSNSNISVRIGSPGDDGDVTQSNASTALSAAANKAKTEQNATQSQGGSCGCSGHGSGSGVQAVGQDAGTRQGAESSATSKQIKPSNSNIPVRIGSKGDNGSVSQSNDSTAASAALNLAKTEQNAQQTQSDSCGCKGGGDAVQAVGQFAWTGQKAKSDATSVQKGASNSNVPVRIKSKGDDGDVSQSNASTALSAAVNAAKTEQNATQDQGGGCGCAPKGKVPYGDGYGDHGGYGSNAVQAIGQFAKTDQDAESSATSSQFYPSNSNAPLRIFSWGGGGSVDQSNDSLAASLALNLALTRQTATQRQ